MNGHLGRQAIVYAMVGGIVYVADYTVYALLISLLPGSLIAANVLGRATGAAVGYLLHGRYTFGEAQGTPRQGMRYALLFVFNIIASSALLWLSVDGMGLNPLIARILVDAVVIVTGFLIARNWVFRAA